MNLDLEQFPASQRREEARREISASRLAKNMEPDGRLLHGIRESVQTSFTTKSREAHMEKA